MTGAHTLTYELVYPSGGATSPVATVIGEAR